MIEVRVATKNDVVGIRDVATKAWYNTYLNIYAAKTVNELLAASYNETHLTKRLDDQLFLVAEDEEDIIGFANFIHGKELYLSAHYVRPAKQHKGTGTKLLEEGLKHFKDQYDTVYLEVDIMNDEAVQYYERKGFELIRKYEHVMYGEKMNLGLFKKEL
ncbi:GNAT family N-acetyltransferase [Staphylococcus massiliensis]|uniref:Putative acetyltransferase n=1 Tax=Staphylococcus massiliensis S46 TaxID=1229783 RepID=K9AFG9_9STAP|nr:GNAT family N-acetyltransferase [Staphylococcus massiliensis]EKU46023.1 putative acetyltransferase [Staphylococcus massiliensis S46]MCG3400291.1 GNAT family N-acetyltransferase [Staphylococcus massiliensis]MCG3401921.1 GNAT family N-acetyltransferase [Staphylococcus massiliensis]MCG3412417.1 GNAT family N-acetyltransferase [Staphylococcus massiliensis]PNZ98010.1 N-acetyltransferase [Staphylococcus massiliensis CCUG 55927]